MLRHGIPEFRLPAHVVRGEIDAILEMGVTLKVNTPIGPQRSLGDLMAEGYSAVYVAIGTQVPVPFKIEGSGLEGVYAGLTYLQRHHEIPVGAICVVIGGGGVAVDCAQLALRRGAQRVQVVCLESWDEMPAGRNERLDAWEEGVEFFPDLGPKRIVGDAGHVTGVEFLEVESVFGEGGEFHPVLRPGTERYFEANTVLLAIGQVPHLDVFYGMDGIKRTQRGMIAVDAECATSVPGIFAGGDVASGPQGIVDAIAQGKKAARSIDRYLTGKVKGGSRRIYFRECDPSFENRESEKIPPLAPPRRSPKERIKDCDEIELAYPEACARTQAKRCVQCHVQTVFDRRRCILCGICIDSCPKNAYKMVRAETIYGDERLEMLKTSVAGSRSGSAQFVAIIKDEERCLRCGMCAKRCPTGAITMQEFFLEEVEGND